MTFATLWSCFLPSVKQSKHIYAESGSLAKTEDFSKSIIHDPNIPKYSTENVERKEKREHSVVNIVIFQSKCKLQIYR